MTDPAGVSMPFHRSHLQYCVALGCLTGLTSMLYSSVDCFNFRIFPHGANRCYSRLRSNIAWRSIDHRPLVRKDHLQKIIGLQMSKDDILIKLHHTAIRTRDISTAIQFYSLFGFQVEAQFRSGPAKCCWLGLSNKYDAKIELIEIPSYILNEDLGTRKRALDSFRNEQLLGLNHMALDVTGVISNLRESFNTTTTSSIRIESNPLSIKSYGLSEYLVHVNQTSMEKFGKGLRIALDPRQQIIGRYVFELAFLYDADGTVLELLNLIKVLDRVVDSGWEPWSGEM